MRIEKLNKVWAAVKASGNEDDTGPEEAKKRAIVKETKLVEEEILNVQKQWISNQADLIDRQTYHLTISSDFEDLKDSKFLLEQKKIRLESQLLSHEKELK